MQKLWRHFMTFTYKIPCFDLEQTAGSGQVFRMIPAPGRTNTWQVISQGHVCFIRQENDIFFLECGPDLENFWKNYFDLNTDYEKMIASITPDDHYLKAASKAGQGIRILRQDTWEMIITFVISQQKTIPAIRALVEALCSRYGTKIDQFYAFPTPEQLCQASLEDLLALKLGYRAKYIYRHGVYYIEAYGSDKGRLPALELGQLLPLVVFTYILSLLF